jgi:hypothetical protein
MKPANKKDLNVASLRAAVSRPAKRRINHEQAIHKQILHGLRVMLPRGWIVQHTPNKPRSKVSGAIEKSMGAVAGWPDLMVLGYCEKRESATAWFFEVKKPKGTTSNAQVTVHDKLMDLGFRVAVVRSWEDALEACRDWDLPIRAKFP